MKTYYYQTNSKAAPFFSDTNKGFVEAESAMEALKKIVSGYTHPCGLFSAAIMLPEPSEKVVARFLSASAVAQQKAVDNGGSILGLGEEYQSKNLVKNKEGSYDETVDRFYVKDCKDRWEDLE